MLGLKKRIHVKQFKIVQIRVEELIKRAISLEGFSFKNAERSLSLVSYGFHYHAKYVSIIHSL